MAVTAYARPEDRQRATPGQLPNALGKPLAKRASSPRRLQGLVRLRGRRTAAANSATITPAVLIVAGQGLLQVTR